MTAAAPPPLAFAVPGSTFEDRQQRRAREAYRAALGRGSEHASIGDRADHDPGDEDRS